MKQEGPMHTPSTPHEYEKPYRVRAMYWSGGSKDHWFDYLEEASGFAERWTQRERVAEWAKVYDVSLPNVCRLVVEWKGPPPPDDAVTHPPTTLHEIAMDMGTPAWVRGVAEEAHKRDLDQASTWLPILVRAFCNELIEKGVESP